jgi:hypothetical protein
MQKPSAKLSLPRYQKKASWPSEKGTDHVIEIVDVPEDGAMLHYVRYPGELSAVGAALPFGGEGLALYGFDEPDDDERRFL